MIVIYSLEFLEISKEIDGLRELNIVPERIEVRDNFYIYNFDMITGFIPMLKGIPLYKNENLIDFYKIVFKEK